MEKIVLMVDNAIIALEIKNNLESSGYLVPFIASTLKEFLKVDCEMDLVIIDMDFIPINRISEVEVPIIFLTSQSESEIQNKISTLQVTYECLFKPFTEEELLQKTRQILQLKSKNP
ncbi:MAG TPA: hypothetical protein VGC02_00235 [Methanobacterium sp.]